MAISEYPPTIIQHLPAETKPQDGSITKLQVKVAGNPKPKVKWLKQGEEIFPSEEYQIENFDDGTSILVINNVYPDDAGEITFEAFNELGVITTTTWLSVEGETPLIIFAKFRFLSFVTILAIYFCLTTLSKNFSRLQQIYSVTFYLNPLPKNTQNTLRNTHHPRLFFII